MKKKVIKERTIGKTPNGWFYGVDTLVNRNELTFFEDEYSDEFVSIFFEDEDDTDISVDSSSIREKPSAVQFKTKQQVIDYVNGRIDIDDPNFSFCNKLKMSDMKYLDKPIKEKVRRNEMTINYNGKTYSNVKIFSTDEKANEFMTTNPGWGVLVVKDGRVFVAEVTNLGDTDKKNIMSLDVKGEETMKEKEASILYVIAKRDGVYKRFNKVAMTKQKANKLVKEIQYAAIPSVDLTTIEVVTADELPKFGVSEKTEKVIVEITEDFEIPGTDIMLEKGDKIEVLKERHVESGQEGMAINYALEELEEAIKSIVNPESWAEKYNLSLKGLLDQIDNLVEVFNKMR